MEHYSNNSKLNAVLNEIRDSLLSMCDTEEESRKEIERYMKSFPYETDYNLFQYGNLLIYYYQIRDLYKDYKSLKNASDSRITEIYRRQVGWVARNLK